MLRSGRSAFLKNHKGSKQKILKKIPSEIKYIKKISADILKSLAPYHVDEDKAFDIRLCVEEAVRNAIVHGNRSDKRLSVKVTYWTDHGAVNIKIEDEGRGFDAGAIADPTTDENMMRNCGRGIYLIRKLMDKVEFNEKGNKIKMVKQLGR